MIYNKIALGTANFDSSYGLFPSNIRRKTKVKNLLIFCKNNYINTIDTSPDYKNAEILLGDAGCTGFKLITKIPNLSKVKKLNDNFMKETISQSLENLKLKRIYALLFRDPRGLVDNNKISLWKQAQDFKTKGIIKKLGVTIYNVKELDNCFDVLKPDIIQVPYNFFDRRLEKSIWLQKLHAKKIEIHCRSVFLQGLLLKQKHELPLIFLKYENIWKKYYSWLQENNLTSLEACIHFILRKKEISKMVLGVENLVQLKKILMIRTKNIKFPYFTENVNEELIDPRKW